ncbi:MAG: hypothetical protein HQL69_10535 [Magnetococcales bacterium]|nr:hypothetical protein [Magnetococcales bacterium]
MTLEELEEYRQRPTKLSESAIQQRLSHLKTWYRIGEYEDMHFAPETKLAAELIAQGRLSEQEAVGLVIQKYTMNV